MSHNLRLWGPHFWYVLHTFAYASPVEEWEINEKKNDYIEFFEWVANILPCDSCKQKYVEKLRAYPLRTYYTSKNALIDWVILLHNKVNQENNKKSYSRDEVDNVYKHKKTFIKHRNYIYLLDFLVYVTKGFNYKVYKEFFKYFMLVHPIHRMRPEMLKIVENFNPASVDEFIQWYGRSFRQNYIRIYDDFIKDKVPHLKLGKVPIQFKIY